MSLPTTELCHKAAKMHSDKNSLIKYLVFTLVQNYATKQTEFTMVKNSI